MSVEDDQDQLCTCANFNAQRLELQATPSHLRTAADQLTRLRLSALLSLLLSPSMGRNKPHPLARCQDSLLEAADLLQCCRLLGASDSIDKHRILGMINGNDSAQPQDEERGGGGGCVLERTTPFIEAPEESAQDLAGLVHLSPLGRTLRDGCAVVEELRHGLHHHPHASIHLYIRHTVKICSTLACALLVLW